MPTPEIQGHRWDATDLEQLAAVHDALLEALAAMYDADEAVMAEDTEPK